MLDEVNITRVIVLKVLGESEYTKSFLFKDNLVDDYAILFFA